MVRQMLQRRFGHWDGMKNRYCCGFVKKGNGINIGFLKPAILMMQITDGIRNGRVYVVLIGKSC